MNLTLWKKALELKDKVREVGKTEYARYFEFDINNNILCEYQI